MFQKKWSHYIDFSHHFFLCIITLLLPLSGGIVIYALLLHIDFVTFFEVINKKYIRTIITFSFLQALISTLLSLIGGIFLALMTIRINSRSIRLFLLQFYGLLFVTPSIIAITAIIAAYGHKGYITSLLNSIMPINEWDIYGFHGIIFAHMFFNMPLAARIFFYRLQNSPIAYFYLAQNLRFTNWEYFKHIDWPALYPTIRSLSLVIFTYCFTSFAIILVFGGTPQYTNLELSIYHHIRYDFDLSTTAILTLLQTVIMLCVLILLSQYRHTPLTTPIKDAITSIYRPEKHSYVAYFCNGFAYILLFFIVIAPLLSIFLNSIGLHMITLLGLASFWDSLFNSLIIGFCTLIISAIISYLTLECWRLFIFSYKKPMIAQTILILYNISWIFTPVIMGAGIFFISHFWTTEQKYPVWYNIVFINSFFSILLMIFLTRDSYIKHSYDYGHLCQSLGLTGWKRFITIDYPLLRVPLYTSCSIIFVMALGDITAITFFRESDIVTLPLYIYHLLFSYQFDMAFATCLWLIILSLCVFLFFSYLQKKDNDA